MREVLIAGLGGFAAWSLIQFISYLVRRHRFEAYFIVHFRIICEVQKENRKWIVAFVDKVLREGQPIKGAPFYAQEDFSAIDDVQSEVIGLLDTYDLSKVTYFTRLLKEIEILLDGFCAILREYQNRGTALAENEVESLLLRSGRILNHIDILPETLREFSDLPSAATIKARQGAETLVLSAHAPAEEEQQTMA